VALRAQLRTEVRDLLRGLQVTTIFVTHDQEEAFALGDEIAVMRDGVVVQQAPPAELYAHPSDAWVAGFVGLANVLPGRSDGANVLTVLGPLPLGRDAAEGGVSVLVRPEHLAISAGDPGFPADAGVPGTVRSVEFYGHDSVAAVDVRGTTLTARLIGPPPSVGAPVAVRYTGPPTVAWPVPDMAPPGHDVDADMQPGVSAAT
jgi:iron(III) transport system ATP-binding protein